MPVRSSRSHSDRPRRPRSPRAISPEPLARPAPLNPVTVLRQVIAALLPAHEDNGLPMRAESEADLFVDFASGNERDRVSLSLAESQVRVRLGEELHLNCEVSSRDELDTAPELGVDLAIQFKFE